jgi:ubiquinone/menaquinone biosynthesis C-methylase UbiE
MKKLFFHSRGVALLEKLIDNSESILDIGCGVGHIVHHFNNRDINTIGVDIHTSSIFAAKEHYKEDSFLIADGTTLPFRPRSFDTIILSYSLHHIPSNIISICKMVAKQKIIIIEMRNHPFLNLIDKIWDKCLPYPNYKHMLPPPDSIHTIGPNEFKTYLV